MKKVDIKTEYATLEIHQRNGQDYLFKKLFQTPVVNKYYGQVKRGLQRIKEQLESGRNTLLACRFSVDYLAYLMRFSVMRVSSN